ncbi:proton-conducting transporter membrane subunit [Cryobacterium roopkundense]|uniref:NADH:ubiquinone oxidoreductase subunit 5 (Subunit L)/multisubunit Na+/H+ antiporter MnhA subunit n=1 Tax=Cryobacterium roopkundense TaxID=1001240 RepID=A0A7W9A0L2_9MICO|nr:proton-conducting transporter membrane subunit [Cryobacterium roopkundense]MBB5643412.1 NADH:ubiquinone oxidoreductase subunit 5 (subunit L)/multisubunit Na+/H+ antiporter MnhA subunit [Cryobacterium roopkundense]
MSDWFVVGGVTLTPWIAGLCAALLGWVGAGGDRAARLAAIVVGIGFVTTVSVAIASAAAPYQPEEVVFGSTSVSLDALALILSMLVLGLSALIQVFAIRYLRGDLRQVWFVVAANLLTGFTVVMVCAGSVALFTVAWIGAGAALVMLLATYLPLAQARDGIRRAGFRFMIADTAFLIPVAILLFTARGDIRLDQLGAVAESLPLPVQLTSAALLVVSALARSSQIPFHGWLPFTLAAPTPVSALMHAGVVNAGAILLIRFAPAIAPHQAVMIGVFVAGAVTLVYASAVRLVRPDVKGRLVFSTMAQMGFMIMACGLGVFAAAIFHLVAHSLFKSTLFLGAGMGVRQHAIDRDLPPRKVHSPFALAAAVTISALVPLAALAAAKWVFAPTVSPAGSALLMFVAVTAGVALGTALGTTFSPRTFLTGTASIVVLAFGYVALLQVFTTTLEPSTTINAAPAWLLAVPAVGLIAVQLLSRNPYRTVHLRDLVYSRTVTTALPRPPAIPRPPVTTGVLS